MSVRIGLYLGVQPTAGGMFQYTQSILKAFAEIEQSGEYKVIAAYGDARWKAILNRLNVEGRLLKYCRVGTYVARFLMGVFCPPVIARYLSRVANPLVAELHKLNCTVWLFPAQDELTWQIEGLVISTIHDLMHRYERQFPEAGNWWRYLMREHRFKNIAHTSQAVLVDSDLGKKHVIDSYAIPADRVYPLRYIAPSYISQGFERQDFDDFYKLPKKFYFYPAQFWPHKNHLKLIEALAEGRDVCSDMSLVLSGCKSHQYETVLRRVSELGLNEKVKFLGYVPDEDMAGLYKRARALIMPSFFGPTNIPPLEAMAINCPSLLSGVYAMKEQSGNSAFYFNPNSVQEMRDLMIRLWTDDDLWAELSKNAKIRSQEWGLQEFEKGLLHVLQDVTRKGQDHF